MKRLIIDLDGTLTKNDDGTYADKLPNEPVVNMCRQYKELGFEIVILTARNMRTFKGNEGKIIANTVPVILTWLRKHDIPFDELRIGKPWCGEDGFYVDDRAIRPSEFVSLSIDEIEELLRSEVNFNS